MKNLFINNIIILFIIEILDELIDDKYCEKLNESYRPVVQSL